MNFSTRTILFISLSLYLASCSVKRGCPSNGKNVGAEKILSEDPKAMRDVKKAQKYKLNKF